jgi:hypothetical protein
MADGLGRLIHTARFRASRRSPARVQSAVLLREKWVSGRGSAGWWKAHAETNHGQRLGGVPVEAANCWRNGGGKEQNERKVVKGDSDDNVNPKMRFKAIFPTTCSQVRESNFLDFFVAAPDAIAGTDSHSEIGVFPDTPRRAPGPRGVFFRASPADFWRNYFLRDGAVRRTAPAARVSAPVARARPTCRVRG